MNMNDHATASAFDEAVRRLLADREISASELARRLRMKSRNGVFRILRGEGGMAARRAFWDALRTSDVSLSESELACFEQALGIRRGGEEEAAIHMEMERFFHSAKRHGRTRSVRVISAEGTKEFGLLLEKLAAGKALHMTITGCWRGDILNTIAETLSTQEGDIRILHILQTDDEHIVEQISAIQNILDCRFYQACCLEAGMFSVTREQMLRENRILIRCEDAQGDTTAMELIPTDDNLLAMIMLADEAQLACLEDRMTFGLDRVRSVKPQLGAGERKEDYVQYTRKLAELEHEKRIYLVKLDIPINYIHPDLLVPGLIDGYAGEGRMTDVDEMSGFVEAMYDIQLRRWENIFTKNRMTHTIFSVEAMEDFARTGFLTDHFFAIRPLVPEERVAILEQILSQARENPNFKVYFFKEGFKPPERQMIYYEGAYLHISAAYTNYDLMGGHQDYLFYQKALCEAFRNYYVDVLLGRSVCSEEETFDILERLIEEAREQI